VSFGKLKDLLPNDAPTRYKLGLCLQHLGRFAEALENFRSAISLGDQDLKTKLAAGACLLQLNDGQAAVEVFESALSQQPDSAEALFGKAVALQLLWEFEQATPIYKQVLAVNPHSEDSLANLISLSLQKKDYSAVSRWSDQLLAERPDAVAGLVDWRVRLSQRKILKPRQNTLPAHGTGAEFVRSLVQPGRRVAAAGRLPASANAYQRAGSIRPEATFAHINLGVVYRENGRTGEFAIRFRTRGASGAGAVRSEAGIGFDH